MSYRVTRDTLEIHQHRSDAQKRRHLLPGTRRCASLAPEPDCLRTFRRRVGNQERCAVCCAADPLNGKSVKVRRGTMGADGQPIAKPRPAKRGPYFRYRRDVRTMGAGL